MGTGTSRLGSFLEVSVRHMSVSFLQYVGDVWSKILMLKQPSTRTQAIAWLCLYVLAPLDALTLIFPFAKIATWEEICSLPLYLLIWLILKSSNQEARIRSQRILFQTIRQRILFFDKDRLMHIEMDAWDKYKGWVLLTRFLNPAGVALIIVDFFISKPWFAIRNVTLALAKEGAAVLAEKHHSSFYLGIHVLIQMMNLARKPDREAIFGRAFSVRLAICITIEEDLLQIFFAPLPLMVLSGSFLVPLRTFFCVIVPLELFGFRALLLKSMHKILVESDKKQDEIGRMFLSFESRTSKLIIVSILLVPATIIVAGMTIIRDTSVNAAEDASRGHRIAMFSAILFAACAVFSFCLRERINYFVQPTFIKQISNPSEYRVLIAPDNFWMMRVAWGLTVVVTLGNYSLMGISVISSLVGGIVTYRFMSESMRNSPDGRCIRRRLLCVYHFVLYVGLHYLENLESVHRMVMLSCARSFMAVDETAPVATLCLELALSSFLQIVLLRQDSSSATASVAIISTTTILLCVANASSSENRFRLVEAVRRAENFLDHAVKQKYSGVGATLEGILDALKRNHTNASPTDDLGSLLQSILCECNQGRDLCHMSAIVRKAVVDPSVQEPQSSLSVMSIVSDWKASKAFGYYDYDQITSSRVFLRVDRDLLRVLLCMLVQNPARALLRIKFSENMQGDVKLTNETRVSVVFSVISHEILGDPSLPTSSDSIRTGHISIGTKCFRDRLKADVCALLGSRFITGSTIEFSNVVSFADVASRSTKPLKFALPWNMPLGSPSTNVISIDSSPNGLHGSNVVMAEISGTYCRKLDGVIPPRLGFAILDDNALVRANVLRLIHHHALADQQSTFVSGKTYEEALLFPLRICSTGVKVAIVDENLEYEIQSGTTSRFEIVSGTTVGTIARSHGYSGCLILHSANGELSQNFDRRVFDGFVEKTSRAQEFMDGLVKAWLQFQSRESEKSVSSHAVHKDD